MSPTEIQDLNCFLADKSYMQGYTPSQADVDAFTKLTAAPGTDFPHALRWYNHIKSYPACEQKSFPSSSTGSSEARGNEQAAKDDDFDLFGSDSEEETEEEARIKAERVAAYKAKKQNKKAVIAKSNIILDVKPWDDTTDMAKLEEQVRTIQADGLLWGTSKLVAVAYGVMKLQISSVIEDDKISTEWLTETIAEFDEYCQSVDIAAFNKV